MPHSISNSRRKITIFLCRLYNWYITETSAGAKTGASDSALGSAAFDIADVGSHTAGNWTAVAAPEPTSGLLMLLGMAGLALRRRRA